MKTDSFRYLVSLDTLLDARLATVSMLDPEYAKKLLFDGWTTRENDFSLKQSPTFTFDAYSALLNKGDVAVLQHALPTLMTNYLYQTIKDSLREAIVGNSVNRHEVIVNTHPYQLTSEEQTVLKEILEDKIPNADKITLTGIPMHFLTPTYLTGAEITHVVLYDFAAWLNLYVETLLDSPIPSITLICPKLMSLSPEETADPTQAKALLQDHSAFSALELQFVMHIALRFIDVSYFSVFTPKRHNGEG